MGAIDGEELKKWDMMQQHQQHGGGMAGRQEKILVLVRMRPLNDKEIAKSEVADWECINANTILYRNSLQGRSGLPTAYTFDRVFSGDCSNRQVYEEGTKEIALSVVSGINSSVFAYGQTSSGKTYTMTGIVEYAVADIYDYIQRHEERAFVLKFSAMEIYNENVRDLLSTDNTSLRLMDDPERGTIVEKLTEETLDDWNHLKKLLSVCEAQRKVGETSLNEASSRSHQILKLKIESSAREFIGKENSSTLSAGVFFIDLAGSERASQSMSAGTRLKEGCHINRSLLTLGNVIRKLSKGRQGYINYRDSKLTRILQPCLGGNGRTTIICTLSPARSYVEQSRNTLLFASCAKEVTTNAQVNVVMSDKALVKHLQKELARLEGELRVPATISSSCNCAASLRKKDLHLEKMEKENKELRKQRDLAQSRVEDLLQLIRNDQASFKQERQRRLLKWNADDKFDDEDSVSEFSVITTPHHGGGVRRFAHPSEDTEEIESAMGEDQCKDVRCVEVEEIIDVRRMQQPLTASPSSEQVVRNGEASAQDSLNSTRQNGFSYGPLDERMQDIQRTIEALASPSQDHLGLEEGRTADTSCSRNQNFSGIGSCREKLTEIGSSLPSLGREYYERTPPHEFDRDFPRRPVGSRKKFPSLVYSANSGKLSRNDSQSSAGTDFTDDVKSQSGRNTTDDQDITSVHTFVAGLKDAKIQYEKQIGDEQEWENGAESDELRKTLRDVGLDPMLDDADPSHWIRKLEGLQRAIIELWQRCNVSLVHRTYFFLLLFKGDPTDYIYLEVEVRRLTFLNNTLSRGSKAVELAGQTKTLASSAKELQRERETLSKLINKRYSEEERSNLYEKWGIKVNSKRRRLKLVSQLWTNTNDMDHVTESASVVAKLVSFSQQGEAQEMFGLSFAPPLMRKRSYVWKKSRASLI